MNHDAHAELASGARSEAPGELVPAPRPSARLTKAAWSLTAIGALVSILCVVPSGGATVFGYGYLWAFTFAWSLVLGSLFFVGLQHLVHAQWSVVVRRVAEMLASPIWLTAVLFVPVLGFIVAGKVFHVFPWADAAHMAKDHVLAGKTPYLNTTFFVARAVVFFGLWMLFGRVFVGTSVAQDHGKAPAMATVRLRKLSGALVVFFGVSATFAGLDWLMSLEPHWFSTMFGVYVVAGMIVSSLAAITLSVINLEGSGRLGSGWITQDHLYNLGGLMFAFSCFWAYIAFSQFMLIWYGHLPEETFYFADRLRGGWLVLTLLLPLVRFVIPFGLLLARPSKSDRKTLVRASSVIIAGQLLDLFWLVAPQLSKNVDEGATPPSWAMVLMLGPVFLLSGLVLLAVGRFLASHKMVAIGDPLIMASRRFHL